MRRKEKLKLAQSAFSRKIAPEPYQFIPTIECGQNIFCNRAMKTPEMEILKTRCVMTVINGEIVWEAPR